MTTRILLESKSSNDPEWQYQANRFLRNCFAQILSKVLPRFENTSRKTIYLKAWWWFQFFFVPLANQKKDPPGLKRFSSHPWAPMMQGPAAAWPSWTKVLWANHGGRVPCRSLKNLQIFPIWRFDDYIPVCFGFGWCLWASWLFFPERMKCFVLYVGHPRLHRLHMMLSRINLDICRFYIEQHDVRCFSRSHLRWFDPFSRNTFQPRYFLAKWRFLTPFRHFSQEPVLLGHARISQGAGLPKNGGIRESEKKEVEITPWLFGWLMHFFFWHFEVTWVNHANEKWKWKNWWRDLLDLKDGTGSWKMEVCLEKS